MGTEWAVAPNHHVSNQARILQWIVLARGCHHAPPAGLGLLAPTRSHGNNCAPIKAKPSQVYNSWVASRFITPGSHLRPLKVVWRLFSSSGDTSSTYVHAHILLKSLLVSFIPYHYSMGGTDRPVRHRETMLLSHSSCRLGYHATQPVWIQHGQWNGASMQGRSCTLPFGSADPYRLRKYQW